MIYSLKHTIYTDTYIYTRLYTSYTPIHTSGAEECQLPESLTYSEGDQGLVAFDYRHLAYVYSAHIVYVYIYSTCIYRRETNNTCIITNV